MQRPQECGRLRSHGLALQSPSVLRDHKEATRSVQWEDLDRSASKRRLTSRAAIVGEFWSQGSLRQSPFLSVHGNHVAEGINDSDTMQSFMEYSG